MSNRTEIRTDRAPAPRPSNSQAIVHNGMIFCSGAIGVDPLSSKLVEGPTTARAVCAFHLVAQAIHNLEAILKEAGSSLQDVIKVNIYLTDMAVFPEFNKLYEASFTGTPRPARTCVCVKELPLSTDVELELVAAVPGASESSRL
ncbi:unnamed protein product [Clonostachys rosea f. rosea IK726]|uniref:Uncharacterized protein n=1 Tax=Clonostachys rosea f. rosea IK726 TaxID=1349383 RepID=A0ACA9TGJ0_BIOOC|nr:unnamed protein product [Clonostachys rosea f. rosea IK726]